MLLASFALHCARARNPLVDPALFRARSYVGATAVMFLFAMAFGAMLLSIVLWLQDDWGWSALRTGLGVAPGPVMVPLFSFLIAGRLIARFGAAVVVSAGCTVLATGVIWWALAVGLHADYARRRSWRHAAHRCGRGADPAHADGDRRGLAAAARVRHRVGAWST